MASIAPQNALSNPTGMPIKNQTMPDQGPVAVPLGPFNFSVQASYLVDGTLVQQLGRISVIQNLFIDNAGNSSNCVVTCQQTGQSVTAGPLTQGYYPILAVQPFKFTVTSAGSTNFGVVIYAINVPIAPCVWPAPANSASLLTQPVSDAILDATVTSNKVNTLNWVFGNNDVLHEQHAADSSVTAIITTTATTTLLTGSPSFFINWIDIELSEDASLAAPGRTILSLFDSNANTTIWQKSIWLPSTALTTFDAGTTLASISGMNWNSKGTASTLQFRCSTALNAGAISVNLGAGLTTDVS